MGAVAMEFQPGYVPTGYGAPVYFHAPQPQQNSLGPFFGAPQQSFAAPGVGLQQAWGNQQPQAQQQQRFNAHQQRNNRNQRFNSAPDIQGGIQKSRRNQHKNKHVKHGHQHASGAPRAPFNSNKFLSKAQEALTPRDTPSGALWHQVTPNPHGTVWKNTIGIDKEMVKRAKEVGIDVLGNTEDAMADAGLLPIDADEDEFCFEDPDVSVDGPHHADVSKLKRTIAEQKVYIADLEDRNQNLEEVNMNLADKLYVLERELAQFRAQVGAIQPSHDAQHSESPHEEEATSQSQGMSSGESQGQAQQAQHQQDPVLDCSRKTSASPHEEALVTAPLADP